MIKAVIFDFWGVVFNPMTGEAQEGLESFVQEAKAGGWRRGIASSSSRQFIEEFLAARHLDEYFEVIVSIDDVKNTKPDPECYLKVAEKLGARPEECLIIDDSLLPVETARRQGFQAVVFGSEAPTFADITLEK